MSKKVRAHYTTYDEFMIIMVEEVNACIILKEGKRRRHSHNEEPHSEFLGLASLANCENGNGLLHSGVSCGLNNPFPSLSLFLSFSLYLEFNSDTI